MEMMLDRDMIELGDMVRRWRMVREMPASVLADRANITEATLRNIERGDGAKVRLGAFVSLVRVLGVESRFFEALEPFNTEIGRVRADRMTRKRAPR